MIFQLPSSDALMAAVILAQVEQIACSYLQYKDVMSPRT